MLQSKDLNDLKIRLGLGPVIDEYLSSYIADKFREPYAGPEYTSPSQDSEIVGRVIWRPSDRGFVRTYERGTKEDLENIQKEADLQGRAQIRTGLLVVFSGLKKGATSEGLVKPLGSL